MIRIAVHIEISLYQRKPNISTELRLNLEQFETG